MKPGALEQAARELWSARMEGRILTALPEECRPTTLDEGYAVQLALDDLSRGDRRAGRRIGWKLGATSAAGREMLGVHEPVCGPLLERFALASGSDAAFAGLVGVVEAEFAITVGRDVRPTGEPITRDDLLDAVASVHPAIELPDSRFGDLAGPGPPQMVADVAAAGLLAVGPAADGLALAELPGIAVSLRRNGVEVATGTGANVLGDPLEALAWLANRLATLGRSLTAGDVVLTGAAAASREPEAGDEVIADFGALGVVSLRLR